MRKITFEHVMQPLQEAMGRMKEALAEDADKNKLAVDASIQRFEFVRELVWKAFKRLLAE